jgi:membrane protein
VTSRAPTRRDVASRIEPRAAIAVGKEIIEKARRDDISGLAAEFAYRAIFAIPAFLIFIVGLAAVVNQATGMPIAEELRAVINQAAPTGTKAVLDQLVQGAIVEVSESAATLGAAVAIVLALWSGSGGIRTLIKAFNRAYEVAETRPFVHEVLVSMGLTILMAVLIVTAFVLFVFGEQIGHWVASLVGLGTAFTTTWNLLRWLLAVTFVAVLLAVLYHLGPNAKLPFRWISLGSVVATLLWVLAALGFRFYLMVVNPGGPFGAAGGILVLLFFLYVTGFTFSLGAEINAALVPRSRREMTERRAGHRQ